MTAIAALLGALSGVVTGLIPGIHVNTVTALVLAGSASCAALGLDYSTLLAFICALAISHTFFDVVPGLFLGVPGDETFALLPGHRLVRKGQGQAALQLSIVGSGIGLGIGLVVVLALLALGNVIGALEQLLRSWMFLVLAGVSTILIATDRRRSWSLFTFLASGLLGLAVFASPLVAGGTDAAVNAFFPALAGLFGIAGLLFAIGTASDSAIPPPASKPERVAARKVAWPGVRGGVAGLLVGLLPGLGAANAATLLLLVEQWRGHRGTDDEQDRAYLVTTSSLNTAEALFAIAALHLIGRSRSGASIAVEQILGGNVATADLLWIALFMTGAGVVASLILWHLGQRLASWFRTVDHTGLNWGVIAFLTVLTGWLLGLGGLAILVAAAAVGLVPLQFGVRRAQLMGFFLVPAMLFYSGYQGQLVDWLSIGQRTAPLLPTVTIAGILLATAVALGAGIAVYLLAAAAVASRWSRRLLVSRSPLSRGGTLAAGLIGGLVLVVALLGWAYPPEPEWSRPAAVPPDDASGRISHVIDGDTFEMATACRRYRVRLKGLDAPELRTRAGVAARDWAATSVEGQSVAWSAVGVDVYGRFLGDVHLEDGTFVNAEIIRQGHARANTAFPFENMEQFQRLEEEARNAERGMWGGLTAAPQRPAPEPPAAPVQIDPTPAALEWDDNGNGRISCAEARAHGIAPVRRGHPAYRYMRDGDGDGVVCE